MRPILMVAVGAALLASGCIFPRSEPLAPIKFGNAWLADHDERASYDAIAMGATSSRRATCARATRAT